MAQSILELIFKTSKSGQGGKQAAAELKNLKGTIGEVSSGLTGFNVASLTAAGAIVAVGSFVKGAVDNWSNYAHEMDRSAELSGINVEQMSRLVQVADDVQVSAGDLEKAFTNATKRGFEPSIENLGNLADELQGMDHLDQVAKLTKIFGKSWEAVYPILKDGKQALLDNTAAVKDGMVVTEESAEANADYMAQVDELNDSWTAFTNNIGQKVVPVLGDVLTAVNANAEAVDRANKMQFSSHDDWVEYVKLQREKIETERLNTEALEWGIEGQKRFNGAMDVGARMAGAYDEKIEYIPPKISDIGSSAEGAASEVENLNTKIIDLGDIDPNFGSDIKAAMDDLAFYMAGGLPLQQMTENIKTAFEEGKITPEMATNMFAEAFVADQALQVEMGKLNADEAARNVQEQLGGSLADAQAQVAVMQGQLDALPRNIAVTIEVATHYSNTEYDHYYELPSNLQDQVVDPKKKKKANAGMVTVPPGFPNDSYSLGMSSGETAYVTNDRMRWTSQGEPSGAVNVNFYGDLKMGNDMDYRSFVARLKSDLPKLLK